ncbi:MAG: sensor histidine kinase [Saprospiraceae bacterium]
MNIYKRKSQWKIYLAIAGIAILVISLAYTTYIAGKIAEQERQRMELWAKSISLLSNIPLNNSDPFIDDVTDFLADIGKSTNDIASIITDENGDFLDFNNLDTSANLEYELARMRQNGDSIPIKNQYLSLFAHYNESNLLVMLRYFPYFQLALIILFIGISYWLFSWARRSEQNQVWVGLAKETAHQLGTPITAIVAWIEMLKMMTDDNEELKDITEELGKDVKRLEQITERFSKIGAVPELKEQNILEVVKKNMDYMKRRAPRRVVFEYQPVEPQMMANFNAPLFDWVLENLLRNALDAMSREGKISAKVTGTKDFVIIDISDSGKGIPAGKLKTVFKPGFSTKKRGWGLGLSLTERIIKNYHNGRIFVKESEIGKGTTFRIQLPRLKK